MAISYITASSAPSGTTATSTTTTLTLTIPTCQPGDLLVCGVGVKPNTASITTPSGWSDPSNGEASGGGGTTGIDTGPTRCKVFYKVATQADSGASLAITLASQNVAWGQILVFRNATFGWDLAAANGIDSTTGTTFTAAMGTDPGLENGDAGAVFGVIPTDVTTPSQFSAPTLTGTGLTASVTERSEPDSSSGNDIGGLVCSFSVSATLTSGVPTFSATAGGTTTNVRGPIVVFRCREVAPLMPPEPAMVPPIPHSRPF